MNQTEQKQEVHVMIGLGAMFNRIIGQISGVCGQKNEDDFIEQTFGIDTVFQNLGDEIMKKDGIVISQANVELRFF